MELKSYKTPIELPNNLLTSLVDSQIECWGSRPFDEYKRCLNEKCRALYSIEDIFGSISSYRLTKESVSGVDKHKAFKCTNCLSDTENFYEKSDFTNRAIEYFKNEVSLALLIHGGKKVEGFGVMNKDSFINVINESFDSRPDSWKTEDVLELLSKNSSNTTSINEEEVICFKHLYISPEYRKGNITLAMLKRLFEINISFKGLPIILETRYDSKFYPLGKLMGFQDILSDKYGGIIQYIDNYSDVLVFLSSIYSFSEKKVLSSILKYRREALQIVKKNNFYVGKKYYN